MSYARFGWNGSDVYVYLCIGGWLECCGCSLSDDWKHADTDAMVVHLRAHEEAGHHVPPSVFVELEADRAENDAWIASVAEEAPPE